MEWKFGLMETDMKGHMTRAGNREKESTFGMMAVNMMEIGSIIK